LAASEGGELAVAGDHVRLLNPVKTNGSALLRSILAGGPDQPAQPSGHRTHESFDDAEFRDKNRSLMGRL